MDECKALLAGTSGIATAVSAGAPAPNVIGNSFVTQFYTVLHSSPAYLYRFYMNDSTLTIAGVGHEPPTTVKTQRGIHAKVMSLGYEAQKAGSPTLVPTFQVTLRHSFCGFLSLKPQPTRVPQKVLWWS